jgi:hypothetical protein
LSRVQRQQEDSNRVIQEQQTQLDEVQETNRLLMEDPLIKLLKENPEMLENLKREIKGEEGGEEEEVERFEDQ